MDRRWRAPLRPTAPPSIVTPADELPRFSKEPPNCKGGAHTYLADGPSAAFDMHIVGDAITARGGGRAGAGMLFHPPSASNKFNPFHEVPANEPTWHAVNTSAKVGGSSFPATRFAKVAPNASINRSAASRTISMQWLSASWNPARWTDVTVDVITSSALRRSSRLFCLGGAALPCMK